MKQYCYTISRTKYDIIISSYTTYKSAIEHISAFNLSSFRWKFLHRNSERYVKNIFASFAMTSESVDSVIIHIQTVLFINTMK